MASEFRRVADAILKRGKKMPVHEDPKAPRNYRAVAFHNQAERGVRKVAEGIQVLDQAARKYRGHYAPDETKALLEHLRGMVDALEVEMAEKPRTTFAWPTP